MSLDTYAQKKEIDRQTSSVKEQGKEIKNSIKGTTDSLKTDSLRQINKSEIKKKLSESVSAPDTSDSASFKFENGKFRKENGDLKAPDLKDIKIPGKIPNPLNSKSGELPDSNIKLLDSLRASGAMDVKKQKAKIETFESRVEDAQSMSDSLKGIVYNQDQLKGRLLNNQIPSMKHVYSSKKLKRIYDSLGYGKIDSLLAMVPQKKTVSEEALIKKLNVPFDAKQPDLPSNLEELGSASEMNRLREDMDLSKVKLPDSVLSGLPPMRGRQIGSKLMPKLDSLRDALLDKKKLKLKEEELTDEITETAIKKKPSFMDKVYFEGVFSFLKNPQSPEIQIAPAVGVKITRDFSLGVGPNILIREVNKQLTVVSGYRSFAKYEILKQQAFLQVEDIVDPFQVSRETFAHAPHSILAGGGYLLPISKKLALNFSLLYRVNNQAYSEGKASPWVFRLGISTTRKRKSKSAAK